MDLSTFNTYFTINVVRYESYPAEEPHCYVVGFNVVYNSNEKSMYTECMLPFSKNIHEYNEVVKEAWEDVYRTVRPWAIQKMSLNPIMSTTVVPTDF